MLLDFFKSLFARRSTGEGVDLRLEEAISVMQRGDRHLAIKMFEQVLEEDPKNIVALNNLGVCLVDVGRSADASGIFSLAYSIDDAYLPVMVNHARMLLDQKRGGEALRFLEKARICDPDFLHVDAVYAGYCLATARVDAACYFQLRAWLGNFDNIRAANCHLFYSAYADIDERIVASEHKFWADTLSETQADLEAACSPTESVAPLRKIRVGYWSPDLRAHSVRYFFRPLLEAHDRSKFEVYVFFDGPVRDAQTDHIEKASDVFLNVFGQGDQEVAQKITDQKLDVLVELAGHSSFNRLNLLKQRLAPLQITALGYPPTTGLSTIDAKMMDRHIYDVEAGHYYTERPLVLDSSFWCFDPKEDVPLPGIPPQTQTGFVTFGCVGNVAKLSARMIQCWSRIMHRVPGSRLLLRSINFEDDAAKDAVLHMLVKGGLDIERVVLCEPAAGVDFFKSYDEIDLILDTYPFNGGTTTCFALYMGVPVVSLAGKGLTSRMGKSALANMGIPWCCVDTVDEYVDRAVQIAHDVDFLRRFRAEARSIFCKSALGDAQRFSAEYERALVEMLNVRGASSSSGAGDGVAPLPANEIMRRAYFVQANGQSAAAARIVQHCLKNYPSCSSAHIFVAQQMASDGQAEGAISYLARVAESGRSDDLVSISLTLARLLISASRKNEALQQLNRVSEVDVSDRFDRLLIDFYRHACLEFDTRPRCVEVVQSERISVVISSDDQGLFEATVRQIQDACPVPSGWSVEFRRCSEAGRPLQYAGINVERQDVDVVVLLRAGVEIVSPDFFVRAVAAMRADNAHIIGVCGASAWEWFDWRLTDINELAGAYLTADEARGGYEANWLGACRAASVHGMAVLDGSVLVARPELLAEIPFEVVFSPVGRLMEEVWTNAAYQQGYRLTVCRDLGVVLPAAIEASQEDKAQAFMRLQEIHRFPLFEEKGRAEVRGSVPVQSLTEGANILAHFCERP